MSEETLEFLGSSYSFITEIPNELFELEQLKNLNLEGNYLEKIPPDIKYLKKLETLKLSGRFHSIPNELTELKNLTNLSLDFQSEKIDDNIFCMNNLRKLELLVCDCVEIPKKIKKLTKLKSFTFSSNLKTIFSKEIIQMENLTDLNVSGNPYSGNIPRIFFQMKQLKSLNLSKTCLMKISMEIENLENLEVLNISQNDFYEFPEQIFLLKNLTELDVSFNSINILPKEIMNLTKLEKLKLNSCIFEELTTYFHLFKSLKVLSLENNHLKIIPKSIFEFTNLQELNLKKNKFTYHDWLPNDIGKLKKLRYLRLSMNRITQFPPEIKELKYLQILEIENCHLRSLDNIHFEKLEVLNVKENYIEEIPDLFFCATKLKYLDFSKNNLKRIPREIENFWDLEYLSFSFNRHRVIPKCIFYLTKLKNFEYNGNCLSRPAIKAFQEFSKFKFPKTYAGYFNPKEDSIFNQFLAQHLDDDHIEKYRFEIEVILDYWKTGHFSCRSLDDVAIQNISKDEKISTEYDSILFLEYIKKESIDGFHISQFIYDIEIVLKKREISLLMLKKKSFHFDLNFSFK
eukprot:gene1992-1500_t